MSVKAIKKVSVTITGKSEEDVKNQVKNYFELSEKSRDYASFSKLQLIKLLRDYTYCMKLTAEGGDPTLIDTKNYVEARLGV